MLLWGTGHDVGRRLFYGVDPELVETAEHALAHIKGIDEVTEVRLRWAGHLLHATAVVAVPTHTTATELTGIKRDACHQLGGQLPRVRAVHLVMWAPIESAVS